MTVRSTRQSVEAGQQPPANFRSTRQSVEAGQQPPANFRVTRLSVEVARPATIVRHRRWDHNRERGMDFTHLRVDIV